MNWSKNKIVARLMGLCALGATSCHPVYYQPITQHVPAFTQKGELYLSANFQKGDRVDAYNMHAAYATGAHWAVGLNGNFVNTAFLERTNNALASLPSKSTFGEINIGYFTASANKRSIFEIYGGLGKGSIENQFRTNGMSLVDLTRLSLQPSWTWRSKYIALIVSSRLSFLSYVVQKNTFNRFDWFDQTNYLNNRTIPLFEPALMFRAGSEQVKGFVQIITAANFTAKNSPYLYNPTTINVGVTININTLESITN